MVLLLTDALDLLSWNILPRLVPTYAQFKEPDWH